MALNLIMLGPPGAGKGTQADRYARSRGIPKISTGDMLRVAVHEGTEVGLRAKVIMDRGELVSDDVMIGIVRERLAQADAVDGFVLDGFPRTVGQARALDLLVNGRGPLVIVNIVVPEAELVHRLASRMICDDCGANARTLAEGGAASGKVVPTTGAQRCSRCGGSLVQRTDDNIDVVRERLKVYQRLTAPLVEYYRERQTFRSVNGAQGADDVASDLAAAIAAAGGLAAPGAVRL